MAQNPFLESTYTEELYQPRSTPVIVITQPWAVLKNEEKEQLTKIAEALKQRINPKLGLDGFKVVYAPALDLSTWPEKPEKLIYFGPPVKGLNNYEVITAGTTNMVLSDSLLSLIADEPAKTKLWGALKQLFRS